MTTKEGCQNSTTSPLNSNGKKKINALKLLSLKNSSKGGTCPPFDLLILHETKRHNEMKESPHSEKSTQCSNCHKFRRSRPSALATSSKAPPTTPTAQIPKHSLTTTQNANCSSIVPEHGGPIKKEADQVTVDQWPQPTKFRSWKISFESEASHSLQYP